jgi:hypothetical protein
MDGGKTSYDRPPAARPSPAPEPPTRSEGGSTSAPEPLSSPEPQPSPPPSGPPVAPAPSVAAAEGPGRAPAVAVATAPPDAVREQTAQPRVPRQAVPVVASSPAIGAEAGERREPVSLSRPRKIAYAIVLGALALSVLGLAYVHLRPKSGPPSAHAGGATTTTRSGGTKSTSTTTTMAALPTTLSPSADAAASALVSSWSTGNRAAALTVATPTAVATLFAAPYTSGLAIARGCSTEFSPIVCTYGPPGGASPSDAIYQILVSQTAGGWYVSSVRVQG